jgi:GNAT superfamily N-acetyltransferase
VDRTIVMRADEAEVGRRTAAGWHVVARSFGAGLDVERIDRAALAALVDRVVSRNDDGLRVRELGPGDADGVLALDAATLGDYPGGAATRHDPLDRAGATPTHARRAFGAVTGDGRVVAVTFVEVDVAGATAETDFTVVSSTHRRRGLATAVKAASVLAVAEAGVQRLRTGGSADNTAIIRADEALGFVLDEEWVTLALPL